MWFWCSAEDRLSDFEAGADDESLQSGTERQLLSMLAFVAQRYWDVQSLIIGSLHTSVASRLLPTIVTQRSPTWAKLIFSRSSLPALTDASHKSKDGLIFGTVTDDDIEEVIATSGVLRKRTTLLASSNTAVYHGARPNASAIAWCYTSREGSMTTLYVRPEERGHGLGKLTLHHELSKAFKRFAYVSAEVGLKNRASQAVCMALGAEKKWEVVWVTIDLTAFRG
jgi:GNAT superfamily N-acetyltransferase